MKKKQFSLLFMILILISSYTLSVGLVQAFVPTLKQNTPTTETTVTLSWDKSDDFTFESYVVTYATSVNGPYTKYATITDKSTTSYAVTNLTPNTAYYFVIEDNYSPNLGITHSTSKSNVVQLSTVPQPTISIAAQTTTTASLQWTDYNSYSTQMPFVSYTIQMSTSGPNGPWSTVTTITDSNQNTYLITGLNTGLYYVYMYDTVGTSSNPQTCATSNYAVISNVAVSISNTSPSTVYQGQQVQFTATPSGGSSHYNYQWFANGNPISGATSSTLTYTPPSVNTYAITCQIQDGTYTDSKATSNSIQVIATQPTPAPTQPNNPTQQPNTSTQSPSNPTEQPYNPTNNDAGAGNNGNTTNSTNEGMPIVTIAVIAIVAVIAVVVIIAVVMVKQKSKQKSN